MENLYQFLSNNSIYIVLFIVLTIWIGIFIYLNKLERKIKLIENEMERNFDEG